MAKPLHRASPAVWGPQTGSSTPGTLGSGVGVSSGGNCPERCYRVKEGGEQAGFAGSHLLLSCARFLQGLPGSRGMPVARETEWPRIPMRDWSFLLEPPSPPFSSCPSFVPWCRNAVTGEGGPAQTLQSWRPWLCQRPARQKRF